MHSTTEQQLVALALLGAAASAQAQPFSPAALTRRVIERRAVEAAIWGMPLVNVDAMRQAYFRAGAKYNDVIFWSNPNTWMNQTTTPNRSTSYVMFFVNLKDGPVVVDIPAATEQALYGDTHQCLERAANQRRQHRPGQG
jgi:hypothetical protein